MPVTRAMSRQTKETKDDTVLSNASTCPTAETKPTKTPRSRTKIPASATTSTSKPPKTEQGTSKSKAKTKKGTTGRKRGKIQTETVEEEEEEEEEYPKPDRSNETQESQVNGGPDEQNRVSLSQKDIESVRSVPLDDPDEMLDSFQRAPKHGVRFAPSGGTSTIPENPDLEEEEELKEEKRIEEERRAALRSQLQKFGAKFNPDGAVVTKAKEISASGMSALKSIGVALEARYKETKKQLKTTMSVPKMPNTPLMKTLTSRPGVKRPREEMIDDDDESPIGIAITNKMLSSAPNTSTPITQIPQSFDFQNMEPKQAQKKLILGPPSTLYQKATIEKEVTCSPAKRPKIFDMNMTDDLDDDVSMNTEPAVKSPVMEVENDEQEKDKADPKAVAVEPVEILPPEKAHPTPSPAKSKAKSSFAAVPAERSNISADDSIIFCEEVIKVPKKVHAHANAPDKHKHQQGLLVKPKIEPPEKIKALISKFSKVDVNAQPDESKKIISETVTKVKEVLPAQAQGHPVQGKTVKTPIRPTPANVASPITQQPAKACDATFSVETPPSDESFHDANTTFTTAHAPDATFTTAIATATAASVPIVTAREVNGEAAAAASSMPPPPPSILNETVVLSKSKPPVKTAESKDSYNITLYEDFDEENKHRENKTIPAWASNKDNLRRELLLLGPPFQKLIAQTVVKRDPIFPFHRPNFKLFPEAVPKIKK